MTIEQINPLAIQEGVKKKGFKAMGSDAFGSVLDGLSAMGPAAITASQQYGSTNSATVLGAAFSGMGATSGQVGGGVSYTGGSSAPYLSGGFKASGSTTGIGGNDVLADGTGMNQADMINTMNQNNLQLLELQATLQSNMQGWNTKSNILSADHRARMSLIEKFQGR